MNKSRRAFVAATAVSGIVIAASAEAIMEKSDKKQLIHHVFFWLKRRGSQEDLAMLLEGLQTLRNIETVRKLHIGVPADTEKRAVVDASYSVSELMFFDDTAGQEIYQDHPLHKKFIATYGHLWEKVVVYDSVDA